MTSIVTIDPVTRIEGHARITIHLNEQGTVEEARLHITQFRGFEKICEGRPFYEMPSLMARICGICPVSHLIASSKACDALLAAKPPRTGELLRRIMNLAQIIQSHALSFFHLSAPDFLLGMDSDPAQRSIFTLFSTHPQIARDGIALRRFGQHIIELLGKKRIHPSWVVPGGVSAPLTAEHREEMLAAIPDARQAVLRTLLWFEPSLSQYEQEIAVFANFPTLYMGLVTAEGGLEHYDGMLRFAGDDGAPIGADIAPQQFETCIGEAVEEWSYLKFPYYKPQGYPQGIYRVGPLARLNMVGKCGTPLADEWLQKFKAQHAAVRRSSFSYHYARLIEVLYAIERIEQILNEECILDTRVRAHADLNQQEGIGVSEAPRGTLMHHYRTDENGLITWANLIIATGHNNLAMNRGITQAAKHYITSADIPESVLNRIEAVIRAYDPCLSCSTHDDGRMALKVQLYDPKGTLLQEKHRQ